MKLNSKKLWLRIARIAVIIVGIYFILMLALSIYISSSKDRLLKFLTARMKETIVGEMKVDKADISVWSSFPKLGVQLNNISISDSVHNFPFLSAKQITAKVGLIDLLGLKITISSVEIHDAVIHIVVDKNGYTNSYVLQPKNKEKNKSKKPIVISNLELYNVTMISENAIKNKRYQVRLNRADIDMSLTGPNYNITMNEDAFIRGLGFNLAKGYWLENQRLQGKWNLQYDTLAKILSFGETNIKIQGQPFKIKGAFYLRQPDAHFSLDISTQNIPFISALAILKSTTAEKIRKLNFSKGIDAHVTLDGPMAYKTTPLVKVDFSTKDNDLVTPVINFSQCTFNGSFINQADNKIAPADSNSRIKMNSFVSKWGDIQLNGKNIMITNLIKPVIQFQFFTQCTLPQLDAQLTSNTLHFTEGSAKLYLAYNGPLIADPSLLNRLDARVQVINGTMIYEPRNLTFSHCNGNMSVTGNNLLVDSFTCNLNTNHFVVNITGNNLNRLSSSTPGKATINCNVFSPVVNLSDFKYLFAPKNKAVVAKQKGSMAQTANSIDSAVQNGNLYVNVKTPQVKLDHFLASNVVANLSFEENDWGIDKAFLQFGDGSFNLAAKVHQASDVLHQISAQMNMQNINVKKLFYGFDNFGQTGLTSANINGMFSTNANVTANINSAGKMDPASLNGKMFFSLKKGALINFKALQSIQQYALKNRDLSNIQFAELKDTFDIKNGDVYIHRMPIQSSALTMYIEGIYSFKQNTDIGIQIPFSTIFNKPGDDFKTVDKKRAKKAGASIFLRAKSKDGQVKVGLDLFRKFRDNDYEKMLNDSL